MTDADAPFVRAICANPDDDLPRLIFADRLEETSGSVACPECRGHGELVAWCEITKENDREVCPACRGSGSVSDGRAERAEFVRVQIELAKHPVCPFTARHPVGRPRRHPHLRHVIEHGPKPKEPCGRCPVCVLWRREGELLDAYARTWKSDWHGMPYQAWLTLADVQWSRGFIARITLAAADLLAHAARVFGAAPVTSVVLSDKRPEEDLRVARRHYSWYSTGLGDDTATIPVPLFNLLDPNALGLGAAVRRVYPTAEAALADLSAACIRWGRQQAGLPAWGPAGWPAGVRGDGSGAYVEGGRATTSGGPTVWPGGA